MKQFFSFQFTIIVALLFIGASIYGVEGQIRRMYFTDLQCFDHNEKLCSDLQCNLTDANYILKSKQKLKLINLGCILQTEVNEMNVG